MSIVPYASIKIKESNEPLVDLSKFDFLLEPVYFNDGLSKDSKMSLRERVANKFKKIQQRLKKYRFKIWDNYRPLEVQDKIYQKYWKFFKDKHPEWDDKTLKLEVGKFVSPAYDNDRIPPHTTGGAVDLTLIDKAGKELNMGTEYDFFGPEAAPFYLEIYKNNIKAQKNRRMLREAMLKEDFTLDEDEW